jgi:hypothetical protein
MDDDDFDMRGQLDQDIGDYLAGRINYGSEQWLELYAAGMIDDVPYVGVPPRSSVTSRAGIDRA